MILQKRQSAMEHNSSAMKTVIAVALAAATLAPASAQTEATPGGRGPRSEIVTHTNLTYYAGEGADKYRHRLDIYVPDGKNDATAIMLVPSGGFTVAVKG